MSYVPPTEIVAELMDAGEAKLCVDKQTAFVRAFMAGAILAIAAAFAISITQQTGLPIVGALLFPVGFCILMLLGYDLLTGVFFLHPLTYLDRREHVTIASILKNWILVFFGNFLGAFLVASITATIFTFGFTTTPTEVGQMIAGIGQSRTIGYKEYGAGGLLTLFLRAMLCNWMVSLGIVGTMISKSVPGKIAAMWMPIMLFFAMTFEHSIVNMYLFPTALMIGGDFSISDYLLWNELPVMLGNLLGGFLLTGLPLYLAHAKKIPLRK